MIKECKHKFVFAKVENWFAVQYIIYCEKCGIDRNDLYSPFKRLFKK